MALPEWLKNKLTTIAEYIKNVYDNGVVDGRKQEWSDFWESYQFGGQRVNYNYAFHTDDNTSPVVWTDETFKPKYSIRPTKAQRAFYRIAVQDVAKVFKERGIEFDTSNCTDTSYLFAKTTAEHLPTLDLSSTTTITGIVFYSGVKKIDKIIWGENITTATNPFVGCSKLAEFVSEGILATSVSFASCPLTIETMKNLILCLKDYSGDTTKQFKYTLTLNSDCWTSLEAEGETSPDGTTWLAYVEAKGWNRA